MNGIQLLTVIPLVWSTEKEVDVWGGNDSENRRVQLGNYIVINCEQNSLQQRQLIYVGG